MAILDFTPSAKPIILGGQSADKHLILIRGLTLSGRQFVPIGHFYWHGLGKIGKMAFRLAETATSFPIPCSTKIKNRLLR